MEQTSFFTNDAAPQPLASRQRPQSLEEFAGQRHLLGPGKVLRRLIESDSVSFSCASRTCSTRTHSKDICPFQTLTLPDIFIFK